MRTLGETAADQARLSDSSVLSGQCRHFDGSERLRLTQRLPDVPGLEHALCLAPGLDSERWSAAAVAIGGFSLSSTLDQAATASDGRRTRRSPSREDWMGIDHGVPRSLTRRRYSVDRTS